MKQKNSFHRNSQRLVLLGSVLALGAPGVAIADDASSQADPTELDEMIVEGEKIERPLRKTPPSTTVLGREVDTPDNRRLQDVLKGMPNILDNSGLGDDLPTIRGIEGDASMGASQTGWTGAQPRVNTLVDGVARPFKFGSSISSQSGVWDVESVEVARGPQMTTTGRSSLTGAVHLSTRDPVHEPEFAVRAGGFTERGTVEGAVMANLPLAKDQVALRFVAEGSDGEPYVKFTNDVLSDEFNEETYEHYRGKLLLSPDALPDTELLFSIENTKVHKPSPPRMSDPFAKDLVQDLGTQWTGFYETDQEVYSVKLLQGLGEKTDLEVRVSHLDNYVDWDPNTFASQFNQEFDVETETTSAEALLHFEELGFIDKGRIGVAYEHQEDWITRGSGSSMYVLTDGEKDNYGVFGEIEAGLSGDWAAIAGFRYERDERRRDNRARSGDPFQRQEWSGNGFSPKLGIRYDGADNYVAGYTYSEGWRSGGVDFHMQSGETTTFEPERLKNHEIWVRANPTDRLSLDGSLFYYVFDDMQYRWDIINGGACGWTPTTTCLVGNIPEVEGYGMELGAQFDITDAWRISGGLGLLETEITDAGSGGYFNQGDELTQSPNVTGNLGLSWVSPRGFGAEISARHVGSFRKTHEPDLKETASYTLFDFKAGYETKLGATDVRIDAWVENLTDKRYVLPGGSASSDYPGRPRTFGVAVTARF